MPEHGRSRCTQPPGPGVVHWLTQKNGDGTVNHLVTQEVADILQTLKDSGYTTSQLTMLYGEYLALNRRARAGELIEPAPRDEFPELKPITKDPEMWELRWPHPQGSPLRQYHAEPRQDFGVMVILKVHMKDLDSEDEQIIREAQNRQIDEGRARYFKHGANRWGLNDGVDTLLPDP